MTSFPRNVAVLMMVGCCQSSFAFVLTNKSKFSCLTTSPRIMILGSTIDRNNDAAGTTDNPFAAFDFERAMDCATNSDSAECSYEEVFELRDAVNEQRLHDRVMAGVIGATPFMKERLEQESYLTDRLTKQLVDLNIEEFTTRTMPEEVRPRESDTVEMIAIEKVKKENNEDKNYNDNTDAEATMTTTTAAIDTTLRGDTVTPTEMNLNLLESAGITLFIAWMILSDYN